MALGILTQQRQGARVTRGSPSAAQTTYSVGLPTQGQFSGCLIGQCLGDALGSVVEGYPPPACERYVAEELGTGRGLASA